MNSRGCSFSTDDELPVCQISIRPRSADFMPFPKLRISTSSSTASGRQSSSSERASSSGWLSQSSSGGFGTTRFLLHGSPPATPTAAKAAALGGADGAMEFALAWTDLSECNETPTPRLTMPSSHKPWVLSSVGGSVEQRQAASLHFTDAGRNSQGRRSSSSSYSSTGGISSLSESSGLSSAARPAGGGSEDVSRRVLRLSSCLPAAHSGPSVSDQAKSSSTGPRMAHSSR